MAEPQLGMSDVLPAGLTENDFFILAAGAAALLVIVLIANTFISRDRLGPRLKALRERRAHLKDEATQSQRRKKPEGSISFMRAIVTKFKLLQKSQSGKLAADLVAAGYRSKDAIYVFSFFKAAFPLLFLVLGFLLAKINFSDLGTSSWKLFIPMLSAYIGFKLPDILLANARGKRYHAIQKALADTLDLLMICAEAGLSLASALERVSRELGLTYPQMADELALTSVEMGFYPDRQKALHNLTERVRLAEIRGIVSVLIQTEKYGTPIAQALRTLSNEFRGQRMLRAEQKAARLPPMMTVPMIIFILPTLFVVIIAPAVIKILDTP